MISLPVLISLGGCKDDMSTADEDVVDVAVADEGVNCAGVTVMVVCPCCICIVTAAGERLVR